MEGGAQGFLVRYAKDCPIDERNRIYRETERQMRAFARARNLEGMTEEELGFEMILASPAGRAACPKSGWLPHPVPTAQEPGKEVRWITENPDHGARSPLSRGQAGQALSRPPRSPGWTMSSS